MINKLNLDSWNTAPYKGLSVLLDNLSSVFVWNKDKWNLTCSSANLENAPQKNHCEETIQRKSHYKSFWLKVTELNYKTVMLEMK